MATLEIFFAEKKAVSREGPSGDNVQIQLDIRHLHIFHNAPFFWDGCNTHEKWKTKVMQNRGGGGANEVHKGDVQVAHTTFNKRVRVQKF